MDTSILGGLGLSRGEVKIYLTLLELGATKVGQIIEKSRMASSAVHNSLNTLKDKGLVTYIKKGKIKFYQGVPPKQLISFIEDKKKQILTILPELELKQALIKEKQEAEIFEGIKGVMSMLNSIIEDGKRGDEYLFFAFNIEDMNEEIQKFFQRYDMKRRDKGLIIKGIAPKKLKPLFVNRRILKMKYTDLPILSGVAIFKDNVALISWGEKPIGYLIRSKQIFEMLREYFNGLWNTC